MESTSQNKQLLRVLNCYFIMITQEDIQDLPKQQLADLKFRLEKGFTCQNDQKLHHIYQLLIEKSQKNVQKAKKQQFNKQNIQKNLSLQTITNKNQENIAQMFKKTKVQEQQQFISNQQYKGTIIGGSPKISFRIINPENDKESNIIFTINSNRKDNIISIKQLIKLQVITQGSQIKCNKETKIQLIVQKKQHDFHMSEQQNELGDAFLSHVGAILKLDYRQSQKKFTIFFTS